MRKLAIIMLTAVLTALSLAGCDDKPDIRQSFDFRVETLPVAGKLKKGETAEIRCTLVREGNFAGTGYSYRYFQPDGKGTLRIGYANTALNAAEVARLPPLVPNDLYELASDRFRMYYTAQSEDRQTVNVYFFDSFGKEFVLSLTFN